VPEILVVDDEANKDAGSLDAELSAIESELDRLDMPSDNDFDSIGSGLE
jgi:hypothetical protein